MHHQNENYYSSTLINPNDIDDYQVFCCCDNIKSPLAYSPIGNKISNTSISFNELENAIHILNEQVKMLKEQLRSVLDAKTEKPKQKWLWEIFEPNDIEIDFPYNL